jgi:hypothetical protein
MWVASGFKFVYSQGNPEGLKTARSWLLVSFIVTIVAFSLQGFILALKATAQKIVPTTTSIRTEPLIATLVGHREVRIHYYLTQTYEKDPNRLGKALITSIILFQALVSAQTGVAKVTSGLAGYRQHHQHPHQLRSKIT